MEFMIYNPQKGRLETINVEFSKDNTTWFDNCADAHDVYMISNFKGGLIINEFGYSYPVWIYDSSRAEIKNNRIRASKMMKSINI